MACFFGIDESHNDINVLERSNLLTNLIQGRTPLVHYTLNGHVYTIGYYLADKIYPKWSTFVRTTSKPREIKDKFFAAAQESAKKDIERAFGVLQARFAIARGLFHFWDIPTLGDIMKVCIIMHNKIVKDERDAYIPDLNYEVLEPNLEALTEKNANLSQIIQMTRNIENIGKHYQLQADLVEHL